MRLVKNTPAPINTDGFIGVCCKSSMKLCSDIKLNMLWCDAKLGQQVRDTRYDGKVHSIYKHFPINSWECATLKEPIPKTPLSICVL